MVYTNKVIGADIKLNINGDISISNSGDIETIVSNVNMLQSARNCILYPHGFDLYNPSFGSNLNLFIGQPNSSELRTLAANDVKNVLLVNPKIKAIPEIITREDNNGNGFSIECSLVPIDEDNTYNLVFPIKL